MEGHIGKTIPFLQTVMENDMSAAVLSRPLVSLALPERGIARYGFTLPMDEALASAVLDWSGRPVFVFEGAFARERVGALPTELVVRQSCRSRGG